MLKGPRIHLRTMRMADLDEYLVLAADISNRGEYFHYVLPTEAGVKERIEKDSYWNAQFGLLLICSNDTSKIVGALVCMQPAPYMDAVEIGYILYDMDLRGKGIMTEAVALATDYIFKARKVDRIQICAAPENKASCKVALKSGYTYEGTLRSAFVLNGKAHDMNLYSMLRSEHQALVAAINPADT